MRHLCGFYELEAENLLEVDPEALSYEVDSPAVLGATTGGAQRFRGRTGQPITQPQTGSKRFKSRAADLAAAKAGVEKAKLGRATKASKIIAGLKNRSTGFVPGAPGTGLKLVLKKPLSLADAAFQAQTAGKRAKKHGEDILRTKTTVKGVDEDLDNGGSDFHENEVPDVDYVNDDFALEAHDLESDVTEGGLEDVEIMGAVSPSAQLRARAALIAKQRQRQQGNTGKPDTTKLKTDSARREKLKKAALNAIAKGKIAISAGDAAAKLVNKKTSKLLGDLVLMGLEEDAAASEFKPDFGPIPPNYSPLVPINMDNPQESYPVRYFTVPPAGVIRLKDFDPSFKDNPNAFNQDQAVGSWFFFYGPGWQKKGGLGSKLPGRMSGPGKTGYAFRRDGWQKHKHLDFSKLGGSIQGKTWPLRTGEEFPANTQKASVDGGLAQDKSGPSQKLVSYLHLPVFSKYGWGPLVGNPEHPVYANLRFAETDGEWFWFAHEAPQQVIKHITGEQWAQYELARQAQEAIDADIAAQELLDKLEREELERTWSKEDAVLQHEIDVNQKKAEAQAKLDALAEQANIDKAAAEAKREDDKLAAEAAREAAKTAAEDARDAERQKRDDEREYEAYRRQLEMDDAAAERAAMTEMKIRERQAEIDATYPYEDAPAYDGGGYVPEDGGGDYVGPSEEFYEDSGGGAYGSFDPGDPFAFAPPTAYVAEPAEDEEPSE